MKVVVVGGAGYIGSVLCRRLLDQGHEVTAFDSLLFGGEGILAYQTHERFRLVAGDMRDAQSLDQVMAGQEAVVLLAAIVGEPACNRDPDLAVETNRGGTNQVIDAAQRAGIDRFVFASTCSNYGATGHDDMVDEEAPLQPISTYASTKVEAEEKLLKLAEQGMNTTVLRFGTAFGVSPRMRFDLMISDFAHAAVSEKKIVVFGEQFWRPFVHIEDISEAICLTLAADADQVSGAVMNVGSNAGNIQKQGLAEQVAAAVPGTELEYVKRDTDPRSYRVDFSRIKERLGFEAKWSIEDGIREVVDFLQQGVWADPTDDRYRN